MTYLKNKKFLTIEEVKKQKIVVEINLATISRIDDIESDEVGSLAAIRGDKLMKIFDEMTSVDDLKAEVQRLQIQLASTKAAHTEACKTIDKSTAEDEIMRAAIKELQEKIEQGKTLADSRNKIIKSLLTIVNEVGF